VLFCLVVAFGIAVMIIAGVANPSKVDSESQLLSMKKDMDDALTAGGSVYSKYSNPKFGGALMIVNIEGASRTPGLADEYQRILLERGWKINDATTEHSYLLCKDGMLARINEIPSTDTSGGSPQWVYRFAMSYSLRTRRSCVQ
jgi:hypothetical protein